MPNSNTLSLDDALKQAVAFHQAGQLQQADHYYRAILEAQPGHSDANHNLGVIAVQVNQPSDALPYFKAALESNRSVDQYWLSYIEALVVVGQVDEARLVLSQGQQSGLSGAPVDALANQLKNAVNSPTIAAVQTLMDSFNSARYAEAESLARAMTERFPRHGVGWKVLGAALKQMGRNQDALASMQMAAVLSPDDPDALNNFASILVEQDQPAVAFNFIKQSLMIRETAETKSIFVACVNRMRFTKTDAELQEMLVRALSEPWCRPSELAHFSIDFVKLNPVVAACLARVTKAWPNRLSSLELYGEKVPAKLASDPVLCALLDAAPMCDIEMERFLTMARHAMLQGVHEVGADGDGDGDGDGDPGAVLLFYAALARHCFINEYLFSFTASEMDLACTLRDNLVAALEVNASIPALLPVVVAAYFPLCALPHCERLLDSSWPDEVQAVLRQQVSEPAEELRNRKIMQRLTDIDDEVSIQVRNQYEENPYPRWTKSEPAGKTRTIPAYLGLKFPLTSLDRHPINIDGGVDILIAGCGTGQHPTGVARRFEGARVLAVDLSLSSLSYAMRKTRELGLNSIEFAQADLLKLGAIDRRFDVIESVGVLHHIGDPFAGWSVLLSLLKPGGFMRLGFYSEVARECIVRIRNFIAERNCGSTADDIRQCRLDLIDGAHDGNFGSSEDFKTLLKSPDFFSISACRDLLFHVQEHRMTLPVIDKFLRKNSLKFVGFEIEGSALQAYRKRFPDDQAALNLAQWHLFESENPSTFMGMYQFWVQKVEAVF